MKNYLLPALAVLGIALTSAMTKADDGFGVWYTRNAPLVRSMAGSCEPNCRDIQTKGALITVRASLR
jgi:hypothetical protein